MRRRRGFIRRRSRFALIAIWLAATGLRTRLVSSAQLRRERLPRLGRLMPCFPLGNARRSIGSGRMGGRGRRHGGQLNVHDVLRLPNERRVARERGNSSLVPRHTRENSAPIVGIVGGVVSECEEGGKNFLCGRQDASTRW